MGDDVVIRPARPGEGAAIAGLIRGSFESSLLECTVYGSAGMAAFIDAELALPRPLAERLYSVALQHDRLAGCIELRRSGRVLALNYIAVGLAGRGAGLARRLLADAITEACAAAGGDSFDAMMLDVFADNTIARSWYDRLGFGVVGGLTWWRLPLPGARTVAGEPAEIAGLPSGAFVTGFAQAEAAHARFSFSEVQVRTRCGEYRIGRLGHRFFRITDPAALHDGDLAAVLRHLDAGRELLALLPEGPPPPQDGALKAAATARMTAPLPDLRRRLGYAPATLAEGKP